MGLRVVVFEWLFYNPKSAILRVRWVLRGRCLVYDSLIPRFAQVSLPRRVQGIRWVLASTKGFGFSESEGNK